MKTLGVPLRPVISSCNTVTHPLDFWQGSVLYPLRGSFSYGHVKHFMEKVIALLFAFVTAEQKREAEPGFGIGHPFIRPYGIGYGYSTAVSHHPYGSHSSVHSYNHLIKKREAEPDFGIGHPFIRPYGIGYGYSTAVSHHPYGSHSSVHSYNHFIKKREAEPDFGIGHPFIRPYGIGYGYSTAVSHHPYGSHSSVHSYNHLIGKREAEPGFGIGHPFIRPYGIGYGYSSAVSHHPYGSHSSVHSYNHLIKKREAEAEADPSFLGLLGPGAVHGYASVQYPGYGLGYQYSHASLPVHYGIY
ncbi:prisilkin-39-like [Penaeus chinensis]|uniref:prisilkin-39-like n=1 Tax=Penaeus chinensis TaxID=139456 RepID=UPI001FB852FC|nr:prisilkin-39-like [Penaeus chinensis]